MLGILPRLAKAIDLMRSTERVIQVALCFGIAIYGGSLAG